MNLTITKKYLVFPTNTNARNKLLCLSDHGKPLYEINIKLDLYAPDFYAYIDVSRFRGMELTLSVQPKMDISYRETDTMELPALYREPLRPQVHFSTKNGWINDPNGLIYLDGIYHMFYQYNPAGTHWDNMHWGHAVSDDLIHWQEQDIAMFLGENGNIFSGSAILDHQNLLGLSEEAGPAALLYYTATTHPFTQRLAYSTDHFQTIQEYAKDPILPHMVGGNRDPKVVYCDEWDTYIMALYLIEHEYGFLSSKNLTDWKLFQRFQLPGEAECPDLFPLLDERGQKKWILMGANDHYVVGRFQDGAFTPLQKPLSLHYGSSAYAGQTFSNMPGGRTVRLCWDRWDSWHNHATSFVGQMGIPMELSLTSCNGTDYLCANPVGEIQRLCDSPICLDNQSVSPDAPLSIPLETRPYLFRLEGAYTEGVLLQIHIFGCSFSIDFSQNQLILGENRMPVSLCKNCLALTVIVDRNSIEIYADGGKAYLSAIEDGTICDYNLPWFSLTSNEGYCLKQLEIDGLNSIWK